MVEQIEIKRLTTGTVFKLLFIGSACTLIPFSLLMGVLSVFDASTVTWNGRHLTGFSGLLASPLIGAMLALVFSGFFGLCISVGLWVYSYFKPLTLLYWKTGEQAAKRIA